MKVFKGALTLLILVFAVTVSAQSRFTQKEKDEFIQELRKDIKEFKEETKAPFKAVNVRDELFKRVAELRTINSISYHEERRIMDRYNDLVAQAAKNPKIDEEKAVFEIIDQELKVIDAKILQCAKEGNVCNDVGCCGGLVCNAEAKGSQGNKCSSSGNTCNVDADCCSGECELNPGSKKKICKEIKRCFRPQALGSRCNENPVCGQGQCLPFDAETSGYQVGFENGSRCKADKECSSNFCQGNVCTEQRVCKECLKAGSKLERGLKCCEGLMPNKAGRCVPDAPPIVLPQVNNMFKPKSKTVIALLASLLLSPTFANDADSATLNQINATGAKAESEQDAAMANQLAADAKGKVYTDQLKKTHTNAKYLEYQKSDFKTCAIDFKSDYYNYMMAKSTSEGSPDAVSGASMFDYTSALLAFEFMSLGEENYDDFWVEGGGSIHKRLKNISLQSKKSRLEVENKLIEYNRKLTCLCLDTMGASGIGFESEVKAIAQYKADVKDGKKPSLPSLSPAVVKIVCGGAEADKNFCANYQVSTGTVAKFKEYKESLIKDKNKIEYYANHCEEERNAYAAMIRDIDSAAGAEAIADDANGDASGVKGTRMLVYWTQTLQDFTMELSVDNTDLFGKFVEVHEWYSKQTTEDLWSKSSMRTSALFNFDVLNNHDHRVYSMAAAIIAATLTVGVMSVIGGLSVSSIISTWTTLGILAATTIAGGGGGYVVASLRGAWIGKTPFVEDKKVRTYDCGSKKDPKTCTTYTRNFKFPFSEICNARVSSNACIKHFLVTSEDGVDNYIVDPWIPVGMKKADIIRDEKTLVSRIDESFQAGFDAIAANAPGGRQSEEYRVSPFLTTNYTGNFAPKFLPNYVETYTVTPALKELIKKKAKEFAVQQKFFNESEKEQLETFANYAYDYHFVWSKSSAKDIIAYPQPAFMTYLDMMSAGVAGKLAVGNANNSNSLRNLNTKYLSSYKKLLNTYKNKAVSGDRARQVAWTNKELKAVAAMENQNMLIDQALNTNGSGINISGSDLQGANIGGGSGLGGNAAAFVDSVKKLRSAREKQLRKLDEFNKNVGSTERGKALLANQKSTMARFSKPSGGSSSLGLAGRSLFKTDSAGSGSGSSTTGNENSGSGMNFNNSGLSNVGASGLDSGYVYGSGGSGSGSGKSSSASNTGSGSSSGLSSEESKRIDGALDALGQNGAKEGYQTNDEDNLWERITKTYIRNYDKILTKRKKDIDEPVSKD